MQYLNEGTRRRITSTLDQAASSPRPEAPVYHLSMEPDEERFEVRLNGDLLGTSRAHGTGVRWLAP
jgi:hypothetical protein